jgi:phosphotriesterase-related protein
MITRRNFINKFIFLTATLSTGSRFAFGKTRPGKIMTVAGAIDASNLGRTLVHEHILVDFIGAAKTSKDRWDRSAVIKKVAPLLEELKGTGCKSLVDCTPNFLGRDVLLLKEISEKTGIQIVTNTGYYGGSDEKFIPVDAFKESEYELSETWVHEYYKGIDGTAIRPGFIKISVNDGPLTEMSARLIKAAAITHVETGLTIASHTGPYVPAHEQLEILEDFRVRPSAFIWVHAQNEKQWKYYKKVAAQDGWVSLDGLNDDNVEDYVSRFLFMKKNNLLRRTLISQDAGWYDPEKPDGGEVRGYTTLFSKLIPALKEKGVTNGEIEQVITANPKEAFTIQKRMY